MSKKNYHFMLIHTPQNPMEHLGTKNLMMMGGLQVQTCSDPIKAKSLGGAWRKLQAKLRKNAEDAIQPPLVEVQLRYGVKTNLSKKSMLGFGCIWLPISDKKIAESIDSFNVETAMSHRLMNV